MNKYELLYIISADLDDESKDKLVKKFEDVVVESKGTVLKTEKWGNKKLAYPINYKNDGFYTLMNFEANPEVPAEIERQMRNTETIIRFMIIKKD